MRRFAITLIAAAICAVTAGGLIAQDSALLQGVKPDRDKYGLEETVVFTYALKNRGDVPLVFTFSSSKQYDLWIKRGSSEIWRHSRGKMYAQAFTTLVIQPGETKSFEIKWNQKDSSGKQVGPGVYQVYAQLTPTRSAPPATSGKVEVGGSSAALVPVTVKECITRVNELLNRRVSIAGIYRGRQPDPSDANCKGGPPVTPSDWVVTDHTGCMYVTGASANLDPNRDAGKRITVVGKVQKTAKGQVYLVLESATVQG